MPIGLLLDRRHRPKALTYKIKKATIKQSNIHFEFTAIRPYSTHKRKIGIK